MAYASSEGRVFFTQDRGFFRMASTPHAGIAYCDKDSRGVGEIIDGLILIWESREPEDMKDRIESL